MEKHLPVDSLSSMKDGVIPQAPQDLVHCFLSHIHLLAMKNVGIFIIFIIVIIHCLLWPVPLGGSNSTFSSSSKK